eukprot:TRINITY_DN10206_c0_g7_i1.p1 TRINITY_DN10206_c0_g7~~TRINITY_DN10206_c0_g7_i1.p1  ORF type:complete len:388 (+),score=96.24 TRINITY_DN10206_c0_g7_i1:268-1431(+)
MERKYFKSSGKKENKGPSLAQTHRNNIIIGKSSEYLKKLLVNSDSEEEIVEQEELSSQREENKEDNAILAVYQNVIKNARSTRVNKLEAAKTESEQNPKESTENHDEMAEENDISLQNDSNFELALNNVEAIPEQEESKSDPAAKLMTEKMSKYEGEVQELKTILFRTFEYVRNLKDGISQPSTEPPSKTLHSPPSKRVKRKQNNQLKYLRRKLRIEELRNKTQQKMMEQLRGDIEMLKRGVAEGNTQSERTAGNFASMRSETEVEKEQSQSATKLSPKSEDVQRLEELNEKLTMQLEDNIRTIDELYNTQELKARELYAKNKEIEAKDQQIAELKVILYCKRIGKVRSVGEYFAGADEQVSENGDRCIFNIEKEYPSRHPHTGTRI